MIYNYLSDKNITVHFVGIGGVSMSGIAQMVANKGFTVTGSDSHSGDKTDMLEKNGIKVNIPHDENAVVYADIVVYNSAISETNVELKKAKELKLTILSRAEILGMILKGYKSSICIGGSHGKSTTCGMLSSIFSFTDLNPSIHMGADYCLNGGATKIGSGELIIAEACEYKRSFLKFYPSIAVILNVELDHVDYYRDIYDVELAFRDFIEQAKEDVVLNYESAHLGKNCKNVTTFGLCSKADYYPEKITCKNGFYSYKAMKNGEFMFDVLLKVRGVHNLQNSLAAIATAKVFGISEGQIQIGLNNFYGISRRFEHIGEYANMQVYTDYAHHPSEIEKLVETIKSMGKNIALVFQPHTYSRTKGLIDGFTTAFKGVDNLIIYETYAAREPYDYLGSAEFLASLIAIPKAVYAKNSSELAFHILELASPHTVLFFVGAGDILNVAKELIG